MIKKAIYRAVTSFSYAIAINIVICGLIMLVFQKDELIPVLPELIERFSTPALALVVQLILIGLTSAAFGFWSIIMEFERIGLLIQSALYFVLTAVVWLPVSIYCWNIIRYPQAFISVFCSYIISYVISWLVQYKYYKESVEKINDKLRELRNEQ